jgi:predicted RND superfamily exporter protein
VRIFERIVAGAGRRPGRTLALVALLATVGALLALRLEPSAATDTLVGRGSDTFQATEISRQRFGDHAIAILVKGDLPNIVLTENLSRLIGLEGCIGGNKPADRPAPGGRGSPCDRFARLKPVQVVYGPGTFLNSAVNEVQTQLAARLEAGRRRADQAERSARARARRRGWDAARVRRAGDGARSRAEQAFQGELLALVVRYGLKPQVPRLDDPDFVSKIVFDASRGARTPKTRLAYLFPSSRAAVIQVRLKPGLSDARRTEAIDLVREAVRMEQWRPDRGVSYVVTGTPVLAEELADSLTASIAALLAVAVLVMAAVLALVFRSRRRLLPLGVALAAVAIVFGLSSLAGAPLTMASVAVLPVLLGLGVDYAIQYQARVEEAEPPGRCSRDDTRAAALTASRVAVPAIATAGVATVVGFGVLLISPVPMVRGFGLLLVVGIIIAFVLALSLGTAGLVGSGGRRAEAGGGRVPRPRGVRRAVAGAGALLLAAVRGAAELVLEAESRLRGVFSAPGAAHGRRRGARLLVAVMLAAGLGFGLGWWPPAVLLLVGAVGLHLAESGAARRIGAGVLRTALERPVRILAIGGVLAVTGWVMDSQTEVVSDLNRLVPQDLPALRDLNTLQASTDVAGEVDVIVEGADLTDPAVVRWMRDYQARLLAANGFSAERGCGRADLCPALSLPDLLTGQAANSREGVRAVLDAIPPYFSQAVITRDRRTASLAFGIKLVPLERQQEIIEDMRRRLGAGRPEGVTARIAGLPVLAAEANAQLSSPWRRLGTLAAGLLAVLVALALIYRRWEHAWVPLVPIALATGWSALVLFALRIPLNPLSATLGALVIAISTEFAVLLSARFREERAHGHPSGEALWRTYRSTGAAVLASGATAIAGFAVLTFSDVEMLKDFGLVTVIDLGVSLLGVLAVLPAVLVLAERRRARRQANTLRVDEGAGAVRPPQRRTAAA